MAIYVNDIPVIDFVARDLGSEYSHLLTELSRGAAGVRSLRTFEGKVGIIMHGVKEGIKIQYESA